MTIKAQLIGVVAGAIIVLAIAAYHARHAVADIVPGEEYETVHVIPHGIMAMRCSQGYLCSQLIVTE